MHSNPPRIQRAEEGHPIEADVPDFATDESELAHFPSLAGMPNPLGQVGAMVEIRDLDGEWDINIIFKISHTRELQQKWSIQIV